MADEITFQNDPVDPSHAIGELRAAVLDWDGAARWRS
jgi:hypothetical protein